MSKHLILWLIIMTYSEYHIEAVKEVCPNNNFIIKLSYVDETSISGALLGLGLVLSMSGELNQDKLSPFECGFNPNLNYRSMFSLQFFVVSLIFLIFDLELVILFPYLLSNKLMMSLEVYLSCGMFILLLSGGLIYEWMSKNLEWCN